jgi:hypothetical protein
MKHFTAATAALALAAITVTASLADAAHDPGRHGRMHKYAAEHVARITRHAHLTPIQKHARMVRYKHEHVARMHRHRHLVKSQHRHEG